MNDVKATGRPNYTLTQDADHNYKMVFRLFAGPNNKSLTRWFATAEDAQRFEERNAIVVSHRQDAS